MRSPQRHSALYVFISCIEYDGTLSSHGSGPKHGLEFLAIQRDALHVLQIDGTADGPRGARSAVRALHLLTRESSAVTGKVHRAAAGRRIPPPHAGPLPVVGEVASRQLAVGGDSDPAARPVLIRGKCLGGSSGTGTAPLGVSQGAINDQNEREKHPCEDGLGAVCGLHSVGCGQGGVTPLGAGEQKTGTSVVCRHEQVQI
jgi:hypothetical protein